jgi:hypothetical protein
MPIDLSTVDWLYVSVLAVLAFVATGVGNLLSFNHRGLAAFLAALIFAALFVGWTYYPHGLPLPTSPASQKAAAVAPAPVAPPRPAVPAGPRNPVSTIYEAPAR